MEQIAENPYIQYLIGLPGYQEEEPFDVSTLVLFRKRVIMKMVMEANESALPKKEERKGPPSAESPSEGQDSEKEPENKGTLPLDVTCAPAPYPLSPRHFPAERGEGISCGRMTGRFCWYYSLPLPRRYRRQDGKAYQV